MYRILTLLIACFIISGNSFAQFGVGVGFSPSISFTASPFTTARPHQPIDGGFFKHLKKYSKQYKNAYSGSLTIGNTQFYGDLAGTSPGFSERKNVNLSFNKRLSPIISFRLNYNIGSYNQSGGISYPLLDTEYPNDFAPNDFLWSTVRGNYSAFSLMYRYTLSPTSIKNIDNEPKFAFHYSIGVGHISSHILLKSIEDEDKRLSKSANAIMMPIMLDLTYIIKNNLGFISSIDFYLANSDKLDLILYQSSDFLLNFRMGLFFKINN
jgi:hypothetical protein